MTKEWESPREALLKLAKETAAKIAEAGIDLHSAIEEFSDRPGAKESLKKIRESNAAELDHNQMMKACRLAYDGVVDNTDDFESIITQIDENNPNISDLRMIFPYLGNVIIGYKTLKDHCIDYINGDEFKEIYKDYEDAKKETIEMIIEIGNDYSEIEREAKKYGVQQKGSNTLFNIDRVPIEYPELAKIVKEIKKYKKKYPNRKIVNHKTVKTAAFRKFLEANK